MGSKVRLCMKLLNYFAKWLHHFNRMSKTDNHTSSPNLSIISLLVISVGVKWNLTVALICISLMTNYAHQHLLVEDTFIIFQEVSFQVFAHVFTYLLSLIWWCPLRILGTSFFSNILIYTLTVTTFFIFIAVAFNKIFNLKNPNL